MQLSPRPVEEKDLPLICSFPQRAEELFFLSPNAVFPLSPLALRETIAQRTDATVVELDGECVAFANFYHWGRDYCAIGNLIVAPAVRGRGVARYLVEQMIALAFTKHQAAEVRISCFNQNSAGLLLYPKLGFQPYAIEARQDQQAERVALIHLRLQRDAC